MPLQSYLRARVRVRVRVLPCRVEQIGSLVFGWWGARRFDQDVKFWRLFADVINDVGLTLDMCAPLCGPTYFLPVLCLGRICCGLCGVSAGATRSTIAVRSRVECSLQWTHRCR